MSNDIGRIVASTVNPATERRAPGDAASSGKTGPGSVAQGTDTVSLTREGKALQSAQVALANTPQVDTGRVQAIKLSLSQGTYQVDATQVARQMINFEASLVAATPAGADAQVAPDGGDRIQRSLSVDPESGTVTRSVSATRDDGTTFSREVSLTRTEEGVTRSSSLDTGRGVTREASGVFDADTNSYSREVTYTGANGGELNVRAKGRVDEGGLSRVIQFEGGRGQPVS